MPPCLWLWLAQTFCFTAYLFTRLLGKNNAEKIKSMSMYKSMACSHSREMLRWYSSYPLAKLLWCITCSTKRLSNLSRIVTNRFSQTQQCNYDKGGQSYMFWPRFEAIFRLFVVEQLIKFLHIDVSLLWDPKQRYRIIKIHEFTKSVYGAAC
jgi:hypothetical protein